jgi:NAD(P)-dependent dehydrogenase (short-subunit alcohol dehydrogenase family)
MPEAIWKGAVLAESDRRLIVDQHAIHIKLRKTVVAFLASDVARWITGASIPVDGGSKL